MARIFRVHHEWEDWLSMLFGVVIGISPWLAGQQDNMVINWNAFLIGAVIIALGALEAIALSRWEEGAEMAAGVWLLASPFIFGYANTGPLRYWHFVLGSAVVLLGALELWQDWKLSAKKLAKHGQ
jgi:SPW repeat-containing protein